MTFATPPQFQNSLLAIGVLIRGVFLGGVGPSLGHMLVEGCWQDTLPWTRLVLNVNTFVSQRYEANCVIYICISAYAKHSARYITWILRNLCTFETSSTWKLGGVSMWKSDFDPMSVSMATDHRYFDASNLPHFYHQQLFLGVGDWSGGEEQGKKNFVISVATAAQWLTHTKALEAGHFLMQTSFLEMLEIAVRHTHTHTHTHTRCL